MRDCNPSFETAFFQLFQEYFDSEKDAARQHDISNYSLDRMEPLAELAGHPEKKLKIVHVAGTKGKGTTSFFISALLVSAGKRTGLFTSPHLCTVRERFQIDNCLCDCGMLLREGRSMVEKVHAAGLHPSLFEIFTLVALRLFVDAGCEYAVMETGIGGRLDATNYVENPVISVITPISFDHMALLGNTIEAIASEKGGIIKDGVPLVMAKQPYSEAEKVLLDIAAQRGSKVLRPEASNGCMDYIAADRPEFLKDNFRTAFKALEVLGIAPSREKFKMPELRARFEKISENPFVMLDAAHNADSMQKLVSALIARYPGLNWTVVLGAVKGKDVHGMCQALSELPNAEFILVNPRTGKGSALTELTAEAEAAGLKVNVTIPELNSRSQLPANGNFLFTGSFFTAFIGEELFGTE